MLACVVLAGGAAPGWSPARAVTVSAPLLQATVVHDVSVSGDGVATYPAFDRSINRYAVTTSSATDGTVTVTAMTSDPAGVVRVDGRLAPGGERTVAGLEPGDEVAVFVDDADGHAVYTFVYVPEKFPTLERMTQVSAVPTREHVLLTLGLWVNPSPFFETAVDANGVPAFVMTNRSGSSMDLKIQPNGHYSVQRGTGSVSAPNSAVVELDEQLREVGSYRGAGLQHTDGHDSILLPDGSRYFLSYEPDPDPDSDRLDAVVQHVDQDGGVLFEWDSREFVDDTVAGANPDYAHVNSLQVMRDGDLLVSFRHFSSVFKIARTAHDGFVPGEVIWKLGGRDSSFDFVSAGGDPEVGPCAQHTASELSDGHILVFDNGSSRLAQELCVDPNDPTGPAVERVPTRLAEWSLSEETGVATLVRDHQVNGRHAIFAGSVQALADDHSMVGWAASTEAVVSELDADGDVLWELRDAAPVKTDRYFTYRAFAADVPDAIAPVVTVDSPTVGDVLVEGQQAPPPSFSCTDRGGSSLQTCDSTAIDTSAPGSRVLVVTATDGDGNSTTLRRRYRVVHRYRPDAMVRSAGGPWVGQDQYGARPTRGVIVSARGHRPMTAVVRVQNDGGLSDRFTLRRSGSNRRFEVRLPDGHTSPELAPGQGWSLRLRVTPRRAARSGDRVRVRLDAVSRGDAMRTDTVFVTARLR